MKKCKSYRIINLCLFAAMVCLAGPGWDITIFRLLGQKEIQ